MVVCFFFLSFYFICQVYVCQVVGIYFFITLYYPVSSRSAVLSLVSLQILVICASIFFIVNLARGLSVLLIFSNNPLFVSLIFYIIFCFTFHWFLIFISFSILLTLDFYFFFWKFWSGKLYYWFEVLLQYKCLML